MFNYRYRTALFLIGAVVSMAGLARGVTVSLKAVKINGVALPAHTDVIDAEPGDLIEAELYFSDWGGDVPGEDPVLKTFQSTINGRASFVVGGST